MAGIPKNFDAISNVLANYDFVDIASGSGYILFYAGNTVDKKVLSNFQYYSDTVITSGTINNANFTSAMDLDFDVLLNRPLDLSGLAIVNIPFSVLKTSGIGTVEAYGTIKIRKWDGSTETDIATNDSRTISTTGASAVYTMAAVDITIPLTHFKKGETLRLSVQMFAKTSAGTNTTVDLGNDPYSRTDTFDATGTVPSKLIFQCPVRLNL